MSEKSQSMGEESVQTEEWETEGETYEPEYGDVNREAARIVSQDRESHGPPYENHEHIAELWSAFLGIEIRPWEVAVMMVMLKASRAKSGWVLRDHLVDICGYADIAWMVAKLDPEVEAHDDSAH